MAKKTYYPCNKRPTREKMHLKQGKTSNPAPKLDRTLFNPAPGNFNPPGYVQII